MKIKTVYTPTDMSDQPFNLKNLYTLTDLGKLSTDLTVAGVGPDDALSFEVAPDGALTITTHKTL